MTNENLVCAYCNYIHNNIVDICNNCHRSLIYTFVIDDSNEIVLELKNKAIHFPRHEICFRMEDLSYVHKLLDTVLLVGIASEVFRVQDDNEKTINKMYNLLKTVIFIPPSKPGITARAHVHG